MQNIVVFVVFSVCLLKTDFVLAQQEGALRLTGPGSNTTHGRVEIFHAGQWGTICNDNFKHVAAQVVCRQLGRPTEGSVYIKFTYGEGTGPIWVTDIECIGTEQRLLDCQLGEWGPGDCPHIEDVGVGCQSLPETTPTPTIPWVPDSGVCIPPITDLRLISPTNRLGMGVVQIFRNGVWGSVCDNEWGLFDARVVCRHLCYSPVDALPGSEDMDHIMANITDPRVVREVHCLGTESNLFSCPQTAWNLHSCGQSEMASVTCTPIDYSTEHPQPSNLTCSDGLMKASFSTVDDTTLVAEHLSLAYNNTNLCQNVKYETTATEITITIPFGECNTTRTANATHIFYTNSVIYALIYTTPNGDEITNKTFVIDISCVLPKNVNAERPYLPVTERVNITAPGEFNVTMVFYRNNSFLVPETHYPVEVFLGETLNAALILHNTDPTLRLVVHNCTATPSNRSDDPVRYPLFIDKCIEDSTVILYPLTSAWSGFSFETFKFVLHEQVHVHCKALVCGQEETDPDCDRSCFKNSGQVGRKKRSISEDIRTVSVSSTTIMVYDPDDPIDTDQPEYAFSSVPTSTKSIIITKSSTKAPPQTSSEPITTKKQSTQAKVQTTGRPATTEKPSTHAPTQSATEPITTKKPSTHAPTQSATEPITTKKPSTHAPTQSATEPITTKKPSTHASTQSATEQMTTKKSPTQIPPQTSSALITTKANQSATTSSLSNSQTPPPALNSEHREEEDIADLVADELVELVDLSRASGFVFSLYSLTQFTLYITLFHILM